MNKILRSIVSFIFICLVSSGLIYLVDSTQRASATRPQTIDNMMGFLAESDFQHPHYVRAMQSISMTISIIYVDEDATGANDGTSWTDAYNDLEPALDTAMADDQVWVAEGTYLPTTEHCGTGNDRYKSFQLENGVAVYGGFDPSMGDVNWDDRDWEGNVTILSGDIGVQGDNGDNSYHVFCHPGNLNLDSSALLDGFTITAGNANYPSDFDFQCGGGMYNNGSSPTLKRIIFSGNTASGYGGGMANFQFSSPRLTWIIFSGNMAMDGGGMANKVSSPNLTYVIFSNNTANWVGGGLWNYEYSSPKLTNVSFSNNTAAYGGGGMLNSDSSPVLTNITFSDNSADLHGGGVLNGNSSPILSNVTFSGNTAMNGGGMSNTASSPSLTNVTFSGNTATQGGAIYAYYYSSPTIINCILWGDTPDEIFNTDYSDPVATYSDIQGGYDGTGNINEDPLLELLADNGGYVMTQALGSGSPAIDAGDPDPATCSPTDARGEFRPSDGDGDGVWHCDMGAYEFQLVPLTHDFLPLLVK